MNTRLVIAALIAASVIAPAAQAAAMLPKAQSAVSVAIPKPLVTNVNAIVKAKKPATLVKTVKAKKIHRKHHAMAKKY